MSDTAGGLTGERVLETALKQQSAIIIEKRSLHELEGFLLASTTKDIELTLCRNEDLLEGFELCQLFVGMLPLFLKKC